MSKIINFKTAQLAKKRGFDIYCQTKYNTEGQYVFHDNGTNILAPTQDDLQTWLEEKGIFVSIAPEFYENGINWNWQTLWHEPKERWQWIETEDDDGKPHRYPQNIMSGTGWYGDNGEYPTRHDALEAALYMGLMKLDILYRHNSIEQLAVLYGVDQNTMLGWIKPFANELGDWSFRNLTPEQLDIIVKYIDKPV